MKRPRASRAGPGVADAAGVVTRAAEAVDGTATTGAADVAFAAGGVAGFAVIADLTAGVAVCDACARASTGKHRSATSAISERDAVRVMTSSGSGWVNRYGSRMRGGERALVHGNFRVVQRTSAALRVRSRNQLNALSDYLSDVVRRVSGRIALVRSVRQE